MSAHERSEIAGLSHCIEIGPYVSQAGLAMGSKAAIHPVTLGIFQELCKVLPHSPTGEETGWLGNGGIVLMVRVPKTNWSDSGISGCAMRAVSPHPPCPCPPGLGLYTIQQSSWKHYLLSARHLVEHLGDRAVG